MSKDLLSKVSIVMSVYNGERYLEAAIRSILAQTMTDYELLIVDDGSTDRTRTLIESLHDDRRKAIFINHSGRAHALNEGIKHTKAPIIAFMDADDVALPDRLKEQYHILQEHPEIGVVSCWYQLMDARNNVMHTIRRLPEQHTDIEYEITKHSSMCFPATMMRRELFDVVGGFNEMCQSAIDYEFFLRLLPVTNFYNLQKVLLRYRLHAHAISVERKNEQRIYTLNFANDYLLHKLHNNLTVNDQYAIKFRLGLNEYYHGHMRIARQWFVQAFPTMWKNWILWRYWFATYLGDKLFLLFRSRL